MKLKHIALFGLLVAGVPAQAQRFGIQLKGGLAVNETRFHHPPLNRFGEQTFEASRLLIGPAVEWRLTSKIGTEFGVLFQSADVNGTGAGRGTFPSTWNLDTSIQHFPVLGKYRFLQKSVAPFGVAGAVVRRYEHDGSLTTATVGGNGALMTSTSSVAESHVDVGWAVGGGVDFKVMLLRITPELRYMRFGNLVCDPCINRATSESRHTVAVMLGIGF